MLSSDATFAGRRRMVAVEAISPAVRELLDHKKNNERTRNRNGCVVRREGSEGRHSEITEPIEKIDEAEPNHANSADEDHHPVQGLDHEPASTAHTFCNRGKVEMICAAGCDRRADENSVYEEG